MEETLDAAEVRVLASLVEKEMSTPDYYPMTLNALTAACNQKSNRDPVVDYSEGEVVEVLERLQRKRLAGTASGAGSRVTKYRHTFRERLDLAEPELAVLCSLMLRGPQTVGEIRGRTGRLHAFPSLEAVEAALEALRTRAAPLVAQLPRQAGQKEVRYAHLLSGEPEVTAATAGGSAGSERLAQMEEEVAALREQLQALEAAFEAFRRQFE